MIDKVEYKRNSVGAQILAKWFPKYDDEIGSITTGKVHR